MKLNWLWAAPAVLLLASCSSSPLARVDGGFSDRLPGWEFQASKPKNGMTYNEFEGYYPDKGGKLISAPIKLDKQPGKSAFYKLTFDVEAPERSYWGVDFYDADGKKLPDCYGVVHPGKRRTLERVIYAMGPVDSMRFFLQSAGGIRGWNLHVEKISSAEAAEWCDRICKELPPLDFRAPAGSLDRLPRTRRALHDGSPFRVVLLGDSIMQDTYHSVFEALLKREFPASAFEFIISMRGSTGCRYYRQKEAFESYVAAHRPDLLIIGGISNSNCADVRTVAEQAKKELGCEVLILTGALHCDTRGDDQSAREWNAAADRMAGRQLKFLELQEEFPVWDMTTPGYRYLYKSGKPFEWFNRDRVHSGERGKQIIGRILLEYFKTARP